MFVIFVPQYGVCFGLEVGYCSVGVYCASSRSDGGSLRRTVVTARGRSVFSFLSTVTASRKGVLSDLNGALDAAKQSPVL